MNKENKFQIYKKSIAKGMVTDKRRLGTFPHPHFPGRDVRFVELNTVLYANLHDFTSVIYKDLKAYSAYSNIKRQIILNLPPMWHGTDFAQLWMNTKVWNKINKSITKVKNHLN